MTARAAAHALGPSWRDRCHSTGMLDGLLSEAEWSNLTFGHSKAYFRETLLPGNSQMARRLVENAVYPVRGQRLSLIHI